MLLQKGLKHIATISYCFITFPTHTLLHASGEWRELVNASEARSAKQSDKVHGTQALRLLKLLLLLLLLIAQCLAFIVAQHLVKEAL